MKPRKGGMVVYIRVSPRDCISCVDIMDKLEIRTNGMSFDAIVRLALSSLIASAQQNGIIPIPDGFEFDSRVTKRFGAGRGATHGKKLAFSKLIDQTEKGYQVMPLIPDTHERRLARTKFDELEFRATADPVNFSQDDRVELQRLAQILYPPESTTTD